MDVAHLHILADPWCYDFMRRFPARITATGALRIALMQLLHQVDGVRPQRFARAPTGAPVFRLLELAQALGLVQELVYQEALASSLTAPHLTWVPFARGHPPEPALTTGGVVMLVAAIHPRRFISPERQAGHAQRRDGAFAILRLLPDDDDPDAGAQVNRFIEPVRVPLSLAH